MDGEWFGWGMKKFYTPLFLLFSIALASAGIPQVSNMSYSQRIDQNGSRTKLVDIQYDLDGNRSMYVEFFFSYDGGLSFPVVCTAISGDAGSGMQAGNSKNATWDASVDWDKNFTEQGRIMIKATYSDQPTGFPGLDGNGTSRETVLYQSISEVNSTIVSAVSTISGNSYDLIAIGGQNGVEIYQIEDDGSILLTKAIVPPLESDPLKFATHLSLTDEMLIVDDRTTDRGMCHIYSLQEGPTEAELVASIPSMYQGSWQYGNPRSVFADKNNLVVKDGYSIYRRDDEDPAKPYAEELAYWDVYNLDSNSSLLETATLITPSPEEVVGSLDGNPKGTLLAYQAMGYPLLHNGIVALPIYARFDSGEWMYVVRLSIDQNQTLSIHEPSASGRISSMVMDDDNLVVNQSATYPEVGSFVDTFLLSNGYRTTFENVPGSDEYVISNMYLDSNGSLLYAQSGPSDFMNMVTPNKTLSLPLSSNGITLPVGQYPVNSPFTLTDKYFVSVEDDKIKVYPKSAKNN